MAFAGLTIAASLLPMATVAAVSGPAVPPSYGSVAAPTHPIVGMAATPSGAGYWLVGNDGAVYSFGDAHGYGGANHLALKAGVVAMAATPSGHGYWLLGGDGGIFNYGDARFHGSTGAMRLNAPIVGLASTPSGNGYWLVASDGGIFAFGDAHFFGSTGAMRLNAPIVGMTPSPDGGGYRFVATDGGMFDFGDAHFFGSLGGTPIPSPIASMTPTPDGQGYWMVDRGGNTYAYGDAPSDQSFDNIGASTAVALAADPAGGFWVATSNGTVVPRGARGPGAQADPTTNAGFSPQCPTPPGTPSCYTAQVQALDAARHADGLNGIQLPSNYLALNPAEQLFVLVDTERADRGIQTLDGLTARLNQASQQGANNHSDPSFGFDANASSGGSNWAYAAGPLDSVELWMYEDGPGGANIDCHGGGSGCWSHRHVILLAAPPGGFGIAGGGAAAGGSGESDALVVEVGSGSDPQGLVFSWAAEVAAGAR